MKTIKLGNEEILLDDELLKFSEHSINQFLQNYADKYSFYTQKHADAQYLHSCLEDRYDAIYSDKFSHIKEMGGSDNLAKAKTIADQEVQGALENVRVAKYNVNLLWGYIRSMDRAHENCVNTCYNMRKELDRLFSGTIKHKEE